MRRTPARRRPWFRPSRSPATHVWPSAAGSSATWRSRSRSCAPSSAARAFSARPHRSFRPARRPHKAARSAPLTDTCVEGHRSHETVAVGAPAVYDKDGHKLHSENAVPTVLFGLLIPLMTAAVGLRLSGRIASLVSAIPLHWIVAAQVYRIGGGIFLVRWADGRLPWQFALPAGIGDVMTGCFAVVVAVLLAQKAPGALRAAYGWGLFGIADLVVAVALGGITSPGRGHPFACLGT